MKKSLIALAALSVFATAAQAQSSVTVYGILDAGYSDVSRTVTGHGVSNGTSAYDAASVIKQKQQAFSWNNYTSSRFGIRGTEDLGGGTRASFVIETGIGSNVMAGYSQAALSRPGMVFADTISNNAAGTTGAGKNGTTIDGTSLGNRELRANLEFNTATNVQVGFGSSAIRNVWAAFDPAGGTNLVGSLITNDAQFSSNRVNGVGVSQKLGDFTVGATLSRNNDSLSGSGVEQTDMKTSSGHTLNLGYNKGPFAFAAATQELKSSTRGTSASATMTNSSAACTAGTSNTATAIEAVGNATDAGFVCQTPGALATDAKTRTDIVAASYDMKVAKLFANYARVKVEDGTQTNASAEGKRDAYVLGAQVPMGKFQLFGLYSWGNNEMVTRGASQDLAGTVTNGRNASKRDVTGYTVGARYNMSKRTFAYASVGETKLDTAFTSSSAPNSDREYGVKVQQSTVGLVHSF